MWPRAEAHGNVHGVRQVVRRLRASMWPRAEAHGNHVIARMVAAVLPASMWPRAEAHGNLGGDVHAAVRGGLQCGRGPKPTEMWMLTIFGTLVSVLQCGRGPKPTEIRPAPCLSASVSCFNVAAGRSPRKSDYQGEPGDALDASMWPRAEAHGNIGSTAAPFGLQLLQCGRGPKPTEILLRVVWCDGAWLLQCGRGPKPTEILKRWLVRYRFTSFNVAAGRSPRKYAV